MDAYVITLNVICIISSVIQFFIEIWQFHIDKDYMESYSNLIDIGGNIAYFIYIIVRFLHPDYELPLNNILYNIHKEYQGKNEFVLDKKEDAITV